MNSSKRFATIRLKTKPVTTRVSGPVATGAPPPIKRLLVASANMAITDHETFGGNEIGTAQKSTTVVLTQGQQASVMTLKGYAGGEVRVELSMTGEVQPNGDVLINGLAKLYEGTSTSTSDLDGTEPFQATVPKNQAIAGQVLVVNEDEGGDFAKILLTFSNMTA